LVRVGSHPSLLCRPNRGHVGRHYLMFKHGRHYLMFKHERNLLDTHEIVKCRVLVSERNPAECTALGAGEVTWARVWFRILGLGFKFESVVIPHLVALPHGFMEVVIVWFGVQVWGLGFEFKIGVSDLREVSSHHLV